MSQNFVVSADVIVRINQEGNLEIVGKGLQTVTQAEKDVGAATKATTGYYGSQTYQVRRLAMDLRMLSIGLMILKREYGGLNPVLDTGITLLYQTSALMSVALGATGIFGRAIDMLKGKHETLGASISAVGAAINAGTLSMTGWGAVALVGVAIGVALSTVAFEYASGISNLRVEIRGLQQDLKELNSEMRNAQLAQQELNAETAKNQYAIAMLRREIDLTGDPTGELGVQLKALESVEADAVVRAKGLAWETSSIGVASARATDQIEDMKEQIAKAYGGPGEIVGGAFQSTVQPPGEYWTGAPREQLGGEVRQSGIVSVEAGEVIMQREQVATMMAGGNVGGGPVSVSISLAGANITGVKDLVSALKSGGAEAANEIRRLELMRKRVRSRA
uniref:Uncharacterized protein n=1 Tax=viral metagenome TaxID=1070528 RepID=A0A6M3LVG9_9ZZZZ